MYMSVMSYGEISRNNKIAENCVDVFRYLYCYWCIIAKSLYNPDFVNSCGNKLS